MRGTFLVLTMLVSLPALGGCASYASLGGMDGSKVYGGTRLDATLISESLSPDSAAARSDKIEHPVLVWEACCGIVDMPFSFIADTVLLPVTVPMAIAGPGPETKVTEQAPKPRKPIGPAAVWAEEAAGDSSAPAGQDF
jgi:uncharacterized protein YceK